ncbi:hypothetical protein EJ08DRAFT_738636 [Tothia fuscella]|uniref:Uncharacterized protein n=1 Tax=Tothia fuscella TaxID=1048955 RepID=A0A9P4NG68_9PEZI|nr:hypothetical protein EJ08DRAFT_738636 [Tothia fuscella]
MPSHKRPHPEEGNINSLVQKAIASADAPTLRKALLQIYATNPICQSEIHKAFVVEEAGTSEIPAKKQRRQRYAACAQCHKQFDTELNMAPGQEKACITHPGELEVDIDHFPDDDDVRELGAAAFEMKTDWRIADFPEAFTWNCCDGIADSAPCVQGRHSTTWKKRIIKEQSPQRPLVQGPYYV